MAPGRRGDRILASSVGCRVEFSWKESSREERAAAVAAAATTTANQKKGSVIHSFFHSIFFRFALFFFLFFSLLSPLFCSTGFVGCLPLAALSLAHKMDSSFFFFSSSFSLLRLLFLQFCFLCRFLALVLWAEVKT